MAPGAVPAQRIIEDVLGATEDRRLAWRRDPYHAIHLLETPDPERVLRLWREDGILERDPAPAFHVLELQAAGGWAARRPPARFLLGVLDPGEDVASLEEMSGEWPRASPMLAVAADDHFVLRRLLAEICSRVPPWIEARTDGHLARLRRVDDPTMHLRTLQGLEDLMVRPLGAMPEGGPRLVAVVALSDPGLEIHPIHRALGNVENFHEERFLTLAQGYARLYELEAPLTTEAGRDEARERLAMLAAGYHAVLVVLPGGRGRILRFRQALDLAHIKAVPRSPTLRSLDLALLNALVLRTVLGIQQPETPDHPQVTQVHSLEELVARVDAGQLQVGFALNPPPLWEIRAVMEARQQLPPGTLTLDPVPPAGLLFPAPEE